MLFILVIAVFGDSALLWAQAPVVPVASMSTVMAAEPDPNSVRLLVGRSTVVDVGTAIARVSLTTADIADALVTSPSQLLINGKLPGTISMFVWDRGGTIRRYEVVVQRDLSRLSEQLRQLFPGEPILAQSNGKDVVLSGAVSSKDIAEKAVNLAAGYVDKKEEVVSLMSVQESSISNQVLLRVRFAEVSRTALTELGASYFTGPNGYKNYTARATTQQTAAPTFDNNGGSNQLVFSDFLNLFLFDAKHQLGTVIKALQTKGLFQSLAEPNLVAESGKEASFLAGGEFPVPIAQPNGGSVAVTVLFKEFGVRLSFTPTVIGNRVHLKVKPEVSTLDFANAVTLGGFRIPALTTRRTETELELQDGQTFAIAGLMNNTVTSTMQKIPGIGDIPILGQLFRSKAAQKDKTELVVMITPQILPRNSMGVTGELPRVPEQFLPALPDKKTVEPPPPAFKRSAVEEPAPVPAAPVAPSAQPVAAKPSAAEAAKAVAALTPSGPKTVVAAPADAPAPAPAAAAPRPLSSAEQKALDRARQKERTQIAKQAEIDREQAIKDKEQEQKAAKAKAKQDAEQAKRDGEAARRAAEAAKRQAEIDRKQQKQIDEAAAKLKAAEIAYQAEMAKKNKQ
jgi:pilus assembly protein CpaC